MGHFFLAALESLGGISVRLLACSVGATKFEITLLGCEIWDMRSEVRSQTTEDRWFKALNIEPQNKEPQNDEVITSIFEIPCSIFCG